MIWNLEIATDHSRRDIFAIRCSDEYLSDLVISSYHLVKGVPIVVTHVFMWSNLHI